MQSPSSGGVRFAPSPTGRFHVGNLRTAWISFFIAKQNTLPWVVRFEDIDKPRVLAYAQEQQLSDLLKLGLKPDIELLQSEFHQRHFELFERAKLEKKIYPCDCSRKDVQLALSTMASAPHAPAHTYSGKCRRDQEKTTQTSELLAWRFKMDDPSGSDDFIIARTSGKEFTPSYHWACAIDDHDGNYDLLVRASDLRESAQAQRAIQNWLGRKKSIPIFHTSLVVANDGARLEKRTKGVTLDELAIRGITPKNLTDLFAQSFDSQISPFDIDGEKKGQLMLSELGL